MNSRPDEAPHRLRWLALVFTVALIWRVAAIWAVAQAPWFAFRIGDAAAYHEWAQEIVHGNWLGDRTFYQAPLYPYCLAFIESLFGDSRLAVVIVQAILGAVSSVLLCDAGWRAISKWTGVISGLLLATYQPAIFFDLSIQKSSLDLLLICGQLWVLSRAVDGPSRKWLFALGAITGLLALNRENALLLALVLGVWVWFSRSNRRLSSSLLYLAGLLLVISPVAIRNRVVGGEWHITTSQFGPNFFVGNNKSSNGTYTPLVAGGGDARFERRDAQARAEMALGRKLSDAEVSSYWTSRALEDIRKEPGRWLRVIGRKTALFWNAVELTDTEDVYTYAEQSVALRFPGRWISFGVLAVLATLGAWLGWREFPLVRLLVVLVVTYAASVIIFYVVARYRLPVVPWLMLLTGLAVSRGLNWIAAASWTGRIGAFATAIAFGILAFWPVIDIDRQRTTTHLNFGAEWSDRGRWPEAIDEYATVLAISPRYVEAHFNLGLAFANTGQLNAAADSFRQALELDPTFSLAALNLGNVELDRKNFDEAERWFAKAVELDPRESRAWNGLGMVSGARNDWPKAVEFFERAVALEPAFAHARQNLAAARARIQK